MSIALLAAFTAVFAFLNRARGSQLYGFVNSTTAGRLISTFFMAYATSLVAGGDFIHMDTVILWAWATLYLWTIFAWDNYWAAAIGHTFNPNTVTFAPADWLLNADYRGALNLPK